MKLCQKKMRGQVRTILKTKFNFRIEKQLYEIMINIMPKITMKVYEKNTKKIYLFYEFV